MSSCNSQNITIKQYIGDSRDLPVKVTKNNKTLPYDLTGWVIKLSLKISKSDPDEDAVLFKEVTAHYDAAGGLSVISITPEDSAAIPLGVYFFDIQMSNSSLNEKRTLGVGYWEFLESVTD